MSLKEDLELLILQYEDSAWFESVAMFGKRNEQKFE